MKSQFFLILFLVSMEATAQKVGGGCEGCEAVFEYGYTLRPASYPNSKAPQHIHPVIKEPNKDEYYIDEYLFTDDPFLDEKEKANQQKRGGSGIITLTKTPDGSWVGKRDIVLGLNIPNYQ